jgi:hypothetical protein
MIGLMRAIHFCRCDVLPDGRVLRRRPLGATLLVLAANVWLSTMRDHVRFLHRRAWLDHEAGAYAVSGVAVIRSNRQLILPRFAGRTLRKWLADPTMAVDAFKLAFGALQRLHASSIHHGDSHAGNVIVCLKTREAMWIDFETAYCAGVSPPARRVNDLRMLIESTLEHVDTATACEVAEVVGRSTDNLELLAEHLNRPRRSVFERAQGHPSSAVHEAFLGDLKRIVRAIRES